MSEQRSSNKTTLTFDRIWDRRIIPIFREEDSGIVCAASDRTENVWSICILTINPNTTTSIIVQVVNDDGALLVCAINAACAALVDAGIPTKHLAVAICCCLPESGYIILDPTNLEERKMKGFAYLVFPNSVHSVLPEGSLLVKGEPVEHGLITSVTHGSMTVDEYLQCLERGRAASAKLSDFVRRSLQSKLPNDPSKAG